MEVSDHVMRIHCRIISENKTFLGGYILQYKTKILRPLGRRGCHFYRNKRIYKYFSDKISLPKIIFSFFSLFVIIICSFFLLFVDYLYQLINLDMHHLSL